MIGPLVSPFSMLCEQVKKYSMLNALVIFAKAPIAGLVKTRLCPPLTFEEAAELYRCFLIDSVSRACTLADVHVCLAFTPAHSAPLFHERTRALLARLGCLSV
jgi:glycosyltransferase A (GT-A) superfamily protein (DUF2064 family)